MDVLNVESFSTLSPVYSVGFTNVRAQVWDWSHDP